MEIVQKQEVFSMTEVALKHGCRPRDISDLFYLRVLDDRRLVRRGKRRLIPRSFLPDVIRELKSRDKLDKYPKPE